MAIKPVQIGLFSPTQSLPPQVVEVNKGSSSETLKRLLTEDLDFSGQNGSYTTHNFHSFPAKFPPQLPRKFIAALTHPGERVLDPMAGSGTTILEAMILGRLGLGLDIDPLALALCKVKVTPLNIEKLMRHAERILDRAKTSLKGQRDDLQNTLALRFDPLTKKFLDYWFLNETKLELLALVQEIEGVKDPDVRRFLLVVFSSIIITKSGGVSLAYDLAHTRPHKLKDKAPRPAIEEFEKKVNKAIHGISNLAHCKGRALAFCGSALDMGLADNSVDLIVTSPPYASNAIDYMRAHKFSLIWMGYPISTLARMRGTYMGGEQTTGVEDKKFPKYPQKIISKIERKDIRKANVYKRYLAEMSNCLSEMLRVLKPGRAAIIVVGSSLMRGIDTETASCLGSVGDSLGFDLIGISERRIDRNKRMMPARDGSEKVSRIEERMHREHVIGLVKPK